MIKPYFVIAVGFPMAAFGAAEKNVAPAHDYAVTPVPFTAVRFEQGLWADRMKTNREVTVGYDFQKCEETGRISNFAKAGGLVKGNFEGIPFNDSDVYKVIEGAAYSLATHPDVKLDKYLDDLIVQIAAAQEADGYLYTARRLFPPEKMPGMSGKTRWSHLASSHELYNVGHLYEAAVAHFQATGKRGLLDVAVKNADLICKTFGPAEGQLKELPGHEEIEIGLVKLYRTTGERKYLDQAKFFIDQRGRAEGHKLRGAYQQDHLPVVEQAEAVGHSVRAGYLYAGVADVAALTGDAALLGAIDRLWNDVVSRKMHLTGGIGSRPGGEAFGDAYELPNATAYNETCAAIANALWNYRMFLLHGDAKYLDVVERVIYNGFLSGISLSGNEFFYPNPLASRGNVKRSPWFGCSCCPVNVVRFIPSLAGYVYATQPGRIYAGLYASNNATVQLDGRTVKLAQATQYPWDGKVKITVSPEQAGAFAVCLRIPGWAQGRPVPSDLYHYLDASPAAVSIAVNRKPAAVRLEKGFATLERQWQPGDTIELDLPMPVRRVVAHEAVKDDVGRVALERGPLVYCLEGVDHGGKITNIALPDDAVLSVEPRPDLLGGVTVLRGKGLAAVRKADGSVGSEPREITAIPYYAWCHRGADEMTVFIPRDCKDANPGPAPTIASQSKASASHVWENDSLAALSSQEEPKNSADHAVSRFTWWDHRGGGEWVQYDFAGPARVRAVEVYWFDDTGHGSCRVPASWRLLYRAGNGWTPVQASGAFAVAKDRYNRVEFAPVETAGLRLEVQLQKGFSGGILQWKVQ
jgi:hypothetical protein